MTSQAPADSRRTFRGELELKDPSLAKGLSELWERARNDWLPLLPVTGVSHSGYLHLLNVERNADKLVPAEAKRGFPAGEIFLLLAAILFHDIGRIIPKSKEPQEGDQPQDKDKRLPCQTLSNECPARKGGVAPCCDPQECHFWWSREFIQEMWGVLGLPDERFSKYCALLAYAHGFREPLDRKQTEPPGGKDRWPNCTWREGPHSDFRTTSLEPYGGLRVPLLAAILRIADETENHWTRCLHEYWLETYRKHGKDLSKVCRVSIEDVEFCHSGRCVIMHVPGDDLPTEQARDLNRLREGSETVIRGWSGSLKPIRADLKYVFFEQGGNLGRELPVLPPSEKPFASIFDDGSDKDRVDKIFDALAGRWQGSGGYNRVGWGALETGLGREIEPFDRWLVQKMGEVGPECSTVVTEADEFVEFEFKDVEEARKKIAGERQR